MWAMFGLARLPVGEVTLRGLTDGSTTAWEYAGSSDTVAYARDSGDPGRFVAEVRRRGKLFGRAETTIGANGQPLKSRLTVPDPPAQLDLTFLSTTRDSFAPDIWLPRHQ
jgi:hypothetical protein